MENKKQTSKIIFTIIFSVLILGSFLVAMLYKFPAEWNVSPSYIYFGCTCACFLFSLLFIKKNAKKIFITLALAVNVGADFFLILAPSLGLNAFTADQLLLIGVSLYCGAQFFYMLYTLLLNKGVGTKIINIALRVAGCLLAYFIIPRYYALSTLEMLSVMYIINSFVTLLVLLFNAKREWLLLLGFLLFFISDIFIGLNFASVALGWSGAFFDFIVKYDISTYAYYLGIFLIATSSVWARVKRD